MLGILLEVLRGGLEGGGHGGLSAKARAEQLEEHREHAPRGEHADEELEGHLEIRGDKGR